METIATANSVAFLFFAVKVAGDFWWKNREKNGLSESGKKILMKAAATPVVSVVIPAFNNAAVIGEALASVRAQTFQDFEVIIIDDGSTDETSVIAADFCKADSRFRLIRQANLGVSQARNVGIRNAAGEWIAFLDSDDVWLPQKLSRLIELSRQEPKANLLFANYYLWDGRQDLRVAYSGEKPLPKGDVMSFLVSGLAFLPSNIIVKRKALIDAELFDTSKNLAEDWDLCFRLALQGVWAIGASEPLARYRCWSESTSVKNRLKAFEANIHVLKKYAGPVSVKYPELREQFQQSIITAENLHELAKARNAASDPAELSKMIWQKWRQERQLKWLRWYLFLVWPSFLGGRTTRNYVYDKFAKVRGAENPKNDIWRQTLHSLPLSFRRSTPKNILKRRFPLFGRKHLKISK